MQEFFRGWRRRAGCFTLVMSCALTAGWVRSIAKFDFVNQVGESSTLLQVYSGFGNCGCMALSTKDGALDFFASRFETYDIDPGARIFNPFEDSDQVWRFCFGGFDCGQSISVLHFKTACQIPYWSIVIPLTLLSTYLLLSKPRQTTSKKITESVPTTGA